MERLYLQTRSDLLSEIDRRDRIIASLIRELSRVAKAKEAPTMSAVLPLSEVVDSAIANAVLLTGGDKSAAARILGISRSTVVKRFPCTRKKICNGA